MIEIVICRIFIILWKKGNYYGIDLDVVIQQDAITYGGFYEQADARESGIFLDGDESTIR